MGDNSEIITNLSFFIIVLSFLFRYILNKLRKSDLIIEKLSKEVVERDKFYSVLLHIIAIFSVLLVIVLIVELVFIWEGLWFYKPFFLPFLCLYIYFNILLIKFSLSSRRGVRGWG